MNHSYTFILLSMFAMLAFSTGRADELPIGKWELQSAPFSLPGGKIIYKFEESRVTITVDGEPTSSYSIRKATSSSHLVELSQKKDGAIKKTYWLLGDSEEKWILVVLREGEHLLTREHEKIFSNAKRRLILSKSD